MGVSFRRSIRLPGGLRLNISSSGVSLSFGAKNVRATKKITGKNAGSTTIYVGKGGLSYTKKLKSKRAKPSR